MKKKYALSVTDFARPAPLIGSIDTYSGFSEGTEKGMQLHKERQSRREKEHPTYLSEVFVKHEFKYKSFIFSVKGRMDGIYKVEKTVIEEIKSSFNLQKLNTYILDQMDNHPFCLQLLTYGYIHFLKTDEIPSLNLHLVSSRNGKSIDLPVNLEIKAYESWLERRCIDLIEEIKQREKKIRCRKATAKELAFPFIKSRKGQIKLIESIQKNCSTSQPMLIQAPTGLGKTMGVLFPILQEAMHRGQKVVYVTPKNSQHTVAQHAVKKLQERHVTNSMTLTAKNKICFKAQTLCNSEYCEFARDYYTKVRENKLLKKLSRNKNITADVVKKIALKYQVCPFELQIDNVPNIDIIICDYNYVFSPFASANRVGKLFLGEKEKPNLIIDEFHNLPERGMGYYSPTLSAVVLKNWIFLIDKVDKRFRDKALFWLTQCSRLIANSGNPKIKFPHKINPLLDDYKKLDGKLREFLAAYLEVDIEIGPNDIVLKFYNYWTEFIAILDYVEKSSGEFIVSFDPKEIAVKITCCDASAMLKYCYDPYKQVIGFSATLKPFEYYTELSGLASKPIKTVEFLSPFFKSNRKLIVIPQVSSKFKDRSRNYPRIAEAIERITEVKQGNYFVFFPSFDFLEKVLERFTPSARCKVISQTKNMSYQDVAILLDLLNFSPDAHLVFAVQGGILSEGVDYPGNMMIGAIIVGVPLPKFDWVREQMKLYYEQKYHAGVDYAYTYPAMSKSVQASGRVIRSESDKGIIILMDDRFLKMNYVKCMPEDWFEQVPQELVSLSILNDLIMFWESASSTCPSL